MITILAVGPEAESLASFGASHPSVEVVTAHDAEEALERLARNRRIDAVLFLAGSDAREAARLIAEEDPGAPPIFSVQEGNATEHLRAIEPGTPAAMLDDIVRALSA
jgi:CheY-like chemotaxis protein